MSEKTLKSRIIHKHDTEANWLLATNFIPKKGELIVYDIDANYDYERFKIGDGVTLVSNLPFSDDQMKEYAMPKYNEGISTYQDDPSLEGRTYCVDIPDLTELKVGMELTIIPHVTSVITGPSLSINGGEKVGMRVTASTTNSSFNGTRPDFMNAGSPVKLMYIERNTVANPAYAVLSSGQVITMNEPGTWANGCYIALSDDGTTLSLFNANGEELDMFNPEQGIVDYNYFTIDCDNLGVDGTYYFSNGTDEASTRLWRIMNSVRVNAEALMSNNANGGGMYACTPGKANEKLLWNTPAQVGMDINKNSIFAATSTNGETYTVNEVPNLTSLYKGLELTILPNKTSTVTSATLNVNGLGAKLIRCKGTGTSGGSYNAKKAEYITANKPTEVRYDGTYWILDLAHINAETLFGQVPVANGGLGRSSLTSGYYLVGNGTNAVALKSKSSVLSDIGALKNGTLTAVNLNDIEDGFYRASTSCTNTPVAGVASIVLSKSWDENYAFQLASLHNRDYLYYRVKTDGTWGSWKTFYSNSNLSFDGAPKANSINPITSGAVYNALDELKTSVSEGKALIASAVTDKGVETADDATFAQMAANIAAIQSGSSFPTMHIINDLDYAIMILGQVIPAESESDIAWTITEGYTNAFVMYETITNTPYCYYPYDDGHEERWIAMGMSDPIMCTSTEFEYLTELQTTLAETTTLRFSYEYL